MKDLPQTQYAVQLVGPDELILNKSKEVFQPGRHQILCRVEAVGLCFSDLKLLKQFSNHTRKSGIVSGIDPEVLKDIPCYVPGEAPTVPGHETVVIIEAVGEGVVDYSAGQRYLVQTDYRWLRTAGSNAAFGYNFEGALQQYVLMDERVITSSDGESMMIPVSEKLSASAVALVEPWACVEDAYASEERCGLKTDGRMLVVSDREIDKSVLDNLFNRYGRPAKITWPTDFVDVSQLSDGAYDDIIYFGSRPDIVEALFTKVATKGLLNIVLCGGRFGTSIVTMVGRVHYGGIRLIGTTGSDPTQAMECIPATDEIRPSDRINVIGAGGPMGAMHVIRNICQQVEGVSVFAGDVDDNRLAALSKIAAPLAAENGIEYKPYNSTREKLAVDFDYTVIMAPIPDLVAASVQIAAERGIINIFAGIPAAITGKIDLDTYIEKQLYFVGTSGSVLEDMKRVLAKVEGGSLDTNVSVAAVCGLDSAAKGIRAVENRLIAGKIIVYPACKALGLIPLEELDEKMPEVARCLDNGLWTKEAEQKLPGNL